MKSEIVLIGAGGHAKTIVDTIERQGNYKIVGFVDKENIGNNIYRSYNVIGQDEDLEEIYNNGVKYAFISIGYMGDNDLRNQLYNKLKNIGYVLPVIIDDTAILAEDVRISEGSYVGRNAVINAEAYIGKMCIINTNAVIEHECIVGEFSHVAVGAVMCGRVKVGNNCMIGANATILQTREIGANTIIGAGTIVTKNIEDNIIYRNELLESYSFVKK